MEGIVGVNIYDAYGGFIGSASGDYIYDASGNCRGYLDRQGYIFSRTNSYLGFLRKDGDIESANGEICGSVTGDGEVYTYKTLQLYVQETDEYNRIIEDYVSLDGRVFAAAAWLLNL